MGQATKIFTDKFKAVFCITASVAVLLMSMCLIILYSYEAITVGGSVLCLETFFIWFLDITKITNNNVFIVLTKAALSVAYIVCFVIMVINFIRSMIKVFKFICKKNIKDIQKLTDDIIYRAEEIFIVSCCFVFAASMVYYSDVSKGLTIIYLVALPILILLRIFQYCLTEDSPKNLSFFLSKATESLIVFSAICMGYKIIASPALFNMFDGFEYFFNLIDLEAEILIVLKAAATYLVKPILSGTLLIQYLTILKLTIKEPKQHWESRALFIKALIYSGVGFGFCCIVDALCSYQQYSQDFDVFNFIIKWSLSQSTFLVPLCLLSVIGIIATHFTPISKKQIDEQPQDGSANV